MPQKKKILALLNPFGGMGLAPRKYEVAKKILDLAHLEITLQETQRQGHAYDILKNEVQPGQYDGIMTISGDGLIHESINGAMSRPDKEQLLANMSFGFIPAGTGNGLHKSVSFQFDEKEGILSAAFAVAKGKTCQMDLTELEMEYDQNEENSKLYMFLMLSWAIISDCDINSEVIRWAGPPRFTLWGIYRVFALRHYPGTLEWFGEKTISNNFHLLNGP
jgi:sphingosine kinase